MKGTFDWFDSGKPRNTAFVTCRYMLQWAFDNMKMKVLADETYNVGEVAVKFGRGNDYVAVVPKSDITAVVHEDISVDDMTVKYHDSFPSEVKAPVKQGDEIGKADLMYNGIKIAEITLIAQQDVKKNYIWAMFSWVEKLMSSKIFVIILIVVIVLVVLYFVGTKNNRRRKKRRKSRVDIVKDYSKLAK